MHNFEYMVIPYKPTVKAEGTFGDIANQFHDLISLHAANGWEYISMNKVDAELQTRKISFDANSVVSINLVVFKRLSS